MAPEREEVPTALAELVDRLRRAGFVDVAEVGSGVVNHVVECRSPRFSVRLTGDRGQWWVEGSRPDGLDWFDADIWEACRSGRPPVGELSAVADQVDYFIREQDALAARAQDPGTWECLRRARQRRTRERLGLPPA